MGAGQDGANAVVGLTAVNCELICLPEFSKGEIILRLALETKASHEALVRQRQAHLQAHSRFARLGDSRGICKEMGC